MARPASTQPVKTALLLSRAGVATSHVGVAEGSAPLILTYTVTNSVDIIHILPHDFLVALMPAPAIGPDIVGEEFLWHYYIWVEESERNPLIPLSS